MKNVLIMSRTAWDKVSATYYPHRLVMVLDFLAIKESDGRYTMIKNRADQRICLTENQLKCLISGDEVDEFERRQL